MARILEGSNVLVFGYNCRAKQKLGVCDPKDTWMVGYGYRWRKAKQVWGLCFPRGMLCIPTYIDEWKEGGTRPGILCILFPTGLRNLTLIWKVLELWRMRILFGLD